MSKPVCKVNLGHGMTQQCPPKMQADAGVGVPGVLRQLKGCWCGGLKGSPGPPVTPGRTLLVTPREVRVATQRAKNKRGDKSNYCFAVGTPGITVASG